MTNLRMVSYVSSQGSRTNSKASNCQNSTINKGRECGKRQLKMLATVANWRQYFYLEKAALNQL